jgi:hypothetical protein
LGTARPGSASHAASHAALAALASPSSAAAAAAIAAVTSRTPRIKQQSEAELRAVKRQFDEIWDANVGPRGLHYGARKLEQFVTMLRKAHYGPAATPANGNDALFLLKQWGVPDGELEHHFIERERLREWWTHEVFGYQGHKINTLLTRHVLGKPRPSFHQLPPGNVHFGKPTVNQEPNIIRDLVEGGFAKECERRPPAQWPPPRRAPGDDGRVHGAASKLNMEEKSKELFALLSYGFGRTMGEGKEHSYAPAHLGNKPAGVPLPRHTRGSALQLAVTRGLYVHPREATSRPGSARASLGGSSGGGGGGGGGQTSRPQSARPY